VTEFRSFEDALDAVLEKDPRYPRSAYMFVQRALDFFRQHHGGHGEAGHLHGEELLRGVRELAIVEFGPMARTVLGTWGLRRGEDVGEIVYNLIEVGLMNKTPEDRKEDFHGVMDFEDSMDAEAGW